MTEQAESPFQPPAGVEPDESDPDTHDDDEAEQEAAEHDEQQQAEPDPGASPEEMERRFKKLEGVVKRYVQGVTGALEEAGTDLLPCPLCSATPWPGFVHPSDAGRMPDDVKRTTQVYLGFAREQDYKRSHTHQTCEMCDGKGKVQTGSLVAGHETITCPNCKGYGYTPPPGQVAQLAAVPGAPPPPVSADGPPAPVADVDPSGEPRILPDGRENPNYGKWPQFKVPVEPWGTTAGLTAQDQVAS